MKKRKLMLGSITSASVAVLPIVAVASCGETKEEQVEINEFSLVINLKTIANDGWVLKSGKKTVVESFKRKDKSLGYQFTYEFVDYLVKKIKKVKLEEGHKVVHLDFRNFDLNRLGSYFWYEIKKIKTDEKTYRLSNAYDSVKGSSEIILNLQDNKIDFWESDKVKYSEISFNGSIPVMGGAQGDWLKILDENLNKDQGIIEFASNLKKTKAINVALLEMDTSWIQFYKTDENGNSIIDLGKKASLISSWEVKKYNVDDFSYIGSIWSSSAPTSLSEELREKVFGNLEY